MCKAGYVATESMVAYTNITSDMSLRIGREAEMDGCVTFPLLQSSSDKIRVRLARKIAQIRKNTLFPHLFQTNK